MILIYLSVASAMKKFEVSLFLNYAMIPLCALFMKMKTQKHNIQIN